MRWTLSAVALAYASLSASLRTPPSGWAWDKFMALLKYTYWQDGEMWLGYLEEYPDYMTQGENMEELLENLKDIYQELIGGSIPSVRHVAELAVA